MESRGPPGGLGGVGVPHKGTGKVRRSTERSGRGWEAHPDGSEGPRGTPGGLVGVERLTERSWGVGRPTRRSSWRYGMSWVHHTEVWEGLGGPPGGSGRVRRPTQWSGRGHVAHPWSVSGH